ncbi:hypothetical protein [Chloroflexus sp.]|uniref:hypothetical protein n=1 Tax=Chloroflexus sp. TaxID=1904827 RepID=UPI00298EEACE|nr:hypothetical protein [Chloroflexus sp.]MDW8404343.1 hypothetical protein [Chloroflexus sp.]
MVEVKQHLLNHLPEMVDFALAHYEDGFARLFDIALRLLDEPVNPDQAAEAELLPPTANQLLSAVRAAWVFGGMGSWNDLAFAGEDGVEYETLTTKLYRLLNAAIVVAVNASALDRRRDG